MTGASVSTDGHFPGETCAAAGEAGASFGTLRCVSAQVFELYQSLSRRAVFAVFGCASADLPDAVAFFGSGPHLPPAVAVFVRGFPVLSEPLRGAEE